MNAMEPTYFLYSGRLFHEAALPALLAQLEQKTASDEAPDTTREPPRPEDPGPEGPEGEPVGEDDEDEAEDDGKRAESQPSPGPGAPMVPEHGSPDANPIDPRVF
jgi:hypothetical protein